jgi:hypothetical protein
MQLGKEKQTEIKVSRQEGKRGRQAKAGGRKGKADWHKKAGRKSHV